MPEHVEHGIGELAADFGKGAGEVAERPPSSTVIPTLPSSAITAIGFPLGFGEDMMQPQPGPIAVPSSTDSGRSSTNIASAR